MEGLDFNDLGLSADELFGDSAVEAEVTQTEEPQTQEETQEETTEVDNPEELFGGEPESVGSEEQEIKGQEEPIKKDSGSTSPNFYSSIATALKEDGILSDLDEETLSNVKGAEDFASLIERQVQSRFDDRQRRINDALMYNVEPTEIQKHEHALHYLDSIREEHLNDESEQGANLRKELIYRDLLNRGFSEEKAAREVQKSINAGTDIQDAKEAKESISKFFEESYNGLIAEARRQEEMQERRLQEDHALLKKSFLEEDDFLKNLGLSKENREKAYRNLSQPIHKDADTGLMLTEMQKAQKEDPINYLRGMAIAYTLTNGFKNFENLSKTMVKKQVGGKLKELEKTLTSGSAFPSGNLELVTKEQKDYDYLRGGIKLDL